MLYTNVSSFVGSLSEVEKISIRMASNDGLDFLFQQKYQHDFAEQSNAASIFMQAVDDVKIAFIERSKGGFASV